MSWKRRPRHSACGGPGGPPSILRPLSSFAYLRKKYVCLVHRKVVLKKTVEREREGTERERARKREKGREIENGGNHRSIYIGTQFMKHRFEVQSERESEKTRVREIKTLCKKAENYENYAKRRKISFS